MDGKRILLVDDDAKLSRVLALRLESEGYDVVAAASGEEALVRLGENRPRFVLADLRMPGMDGIELLAKIQEKYPGLPVALISAQGDIPEAVRATCTPRARRHRRPSDSSGNLVRIKCGSEILESAAVRAACT